MERARPARAQGGAPQRAVSMLVYRYEEVGLQHHTTLRMACRFLRRVTRTCDAASIAQVGCTELPRC
jgi:hypothetical protein